MINKAINLFNSMSFTKKYIFALSLIALFSILAYFNLTNLINSQANDGEVINTSGRQRMLSQKIALFAIYYKTRQLNETINLMETSHKSLISREMSQELKELYFSKPIQLDKRVKTYLYHAHTFVKNRNGKSLTYILENSQNLLKDLDKAVYLYQTETESKIKRLKENELYIICLTLLTLLFEALFIFRPIFDNINKKTEALINEKNYSDTIIESNTNAIIAIGKDFNVYTYNKSAEKIFGYTKNEIMGKNSLHKIIPDKYIKSHNYGLANFIETGKLKHENKIFELEAKRKNGEEFPIRISFGVNNDKDNRIIVANIQDITNEKEKDRLFIQQSRTAAMGEMIGNIAHQWRQPLSAISTIASGAKIRKNLNLISDKEIDTAFTKIANHTQYLSQTIDDFRNFFNQDNKKMIFCLKDVIQKSLTLTEAAYKNSDIIIRPEFLDEDLMCEGSPSKLAQVFLNILNNAKDILIERDIKEKIVLITLKKEKNYIVINIYDNAKGIPKDILPKIFDPYFTTKHQAQGTGIGLYMSKEIIEKHLNGILTASNTEFQIKGKNYFGAAFTIKIPHVNQKEMSENYINS